MNGFSYLFLNVYKSMTFWERVKSYHSLSFPLSFLLAAGLSLLILRGYSALNAPCVRMEPTSMRTKPAACAGPVGFTIDFKVLVIITVTIQ